jgi:hypothetical protein
MPTPEETIALYLKQRRFRLRLVGVALAVAIVAGAVWQVLGYALPSWKITLLAGGFVFFPVFFWQSSRKDYVSTRDALRARRELLEQRRR